MLRLRHSLLEVSTIDKYSKIGSDLTLSVIPLKYVTPKTNTYYIATLIQKRGKQSLSFPSSKPSAGIVSVCLK